MSVSTSKSTDVEIYFGMYSDGKEGGSDGKEGSKDGGADQLFAFPKDPNDLAEVDYQF